MQRRRVTVFAPTVPSFPCFADWRASRRTRRVATGARLVVFGCDEEKKGSWTAAQCCKVWFAALLFHCQRTMDNPHLRLVPLCIRPTRVC